MPTTPCGRTASRKGVPFTETGFAQHLETCPSVECATRRRDIKRAARKAANEELQALSHLRSVQRKNGEVDPDGLIPKDTPDGAFWAMHNEIYGW